MAGVPARTEPALTLLVDYFERLAGVSVDNVRDIHDVPIDQITEAEGGESLAAGIVTGAVEIEGKKVIVLDQGDGSGSPRTRR